MKLHQKITLLIIAILVMVIASIGVLSFNQMKKTLINQLGRDLMDMAVMVSSMEIVKDNIVKPNGSLIIQEAIEKMRLRTRLQFIVVMDMKGIRYSHPIPENVGDSFVGGDEEFALKLGKVYYSEGVGGLGPSIRAFAPIYKDGEQKGAVCVGLLTGRVYHDIYTNLLKFIPVLIVGLILGISGAWAISKNIKKTIFGLEPKEIAYILSEKEAVLQSVGEGIVATDEKGEVLLSNQSAEEILRLDKTIVGSSIGELIKDNNIFKVLDNGQPIINYESKIRDELTLMCSYYPLRNKKNIIVGAVVSFKDLTEVKQLAEELTGAKKITEALRAQNHEFMNKLHTITGLIHLKEYDTAVKYISDIAAARQEVVGILSNRIKDVSTAGLLLTKYVKAQEDRIDFEIDEKSKLNRLPEGCTSDELCSVLGNLIENSIDAVINQGNGKIIVKILDDGNILNIEVSDNGPGIAPPIVGRIFERGVSSKEGQRGYGLYIVKQIIDYFNGSIDFEIDNGTTWRVNIPMKRGVEND